MDTASIFSSTILGLIEGITEFLPVSSTGHMLLADHFLGYANAGAVFEIVIQLGAILAVLAVYFERLWRAVVTLPTREESRRFALSVLAAFLPAAVIGAALHGFIKRVLFASPLLIAISLIVGGLIILVVERRQMRDTYSNSETNQIKKENGIPAFAGMTMFLQRILPSSSRRRGAHLVQGGKIQKGHYTDSENLPLKTSLGIGLFQCLAMIPGVSRSGATIVGAMVIGVSRKAAAEFSFFLSIPTMLAAAAYDVYKNIDQLNMADFQNIAIGFVVAFFSALVVVRTFVGFISRFGLVPFAWYRIALGAAVLFALGMGL